MPLKSTRLEIPDVILVEPVRHQDPRGFFSETYSRRDLRENGITRRLCARQPLSLAPARRCSRPAFSDRARAASQARTRCPGGSLRRRRRPSPWLANVWQVGRGRPQRGELAPAVHSRRDLRTASALCRPDTELLYKTSDYYAPEHDRGIAWDDPDLAIEWPVARQDAVLSTKDASQPRLSDLPRYFSLLRL